MEVLKGLAETLETTRKLFIELHGYRIKDFGSSDTELKDFLKEKGFMLHEIGNREGEKHIKAEK